MDTGLGGTFPLRWHSNGQTGNCCSGTCPERRKVAAVDTHKQRRAKDALTDDRLSEGRGETNRSSLTQVSEGNDVQPPPPPPPPPPPFNLAAVGCVVA